MRLLQMCIGAGCALVSIGAIGAAGAAPADRIPKLAVEKTCRGAAGSGLLTGSSGKISADERKQSFNNCMSAENAARKTAAERWPRVKGENRSTCVSMASAIFPSYVELDACLQMYDPKDGSVNAPAASETAPKGKVRQPRPAPGGT